VAGRPLSIRNLMAAAATPDGRNPTRQWHAGIIASGSDVTAKLSRLDFSQRLVFLQIFVSPVRQLNST
jgi:hypothetical protein